MAFDGLPSGGRERTTHRGIYSHSFSASSHALRKFRITRAIGVNLVSMDWRRNSNSNREPTSHLGSFGVEIRPKSNAAVVSKIAVKDTSWRRGVDVVVITAVSELGLCGRCQQG